MLLVIDFINNKKTEKIGSIEPSYKPGVTFSNLNEILPKLVSDTLKEGIQYFDTKIKGFASDDAICMAKKLCKELGLNVGISSGANFLGCVLSGEQSCATVFADDNKKYLSTDLTNDEIKSDLIDNIELIKYSIV